jgi:hypothetical protein
MPYDISNQIAAMEAHRAIEAQRAQAAERNRVGPSYVSGLSENARNSGTPWYMSDELSDANVKTRDADVYHAAMLQRYLNGDPSYAGDARGFAGSTDASTVQSALNNLLARSANRQGIKSSLNAMPGMEQQEEGLLKRDASDAMGQGIRNTRQNYNQRGLLYSGMREGGEAKVRAQTAGTLESQIASTRQDYAKATDAKQQALVSLGMADEKEKLDRANALFETTTKNNIARQQAFQQLGEGVGYAAGAYYGSHNQPAGSNYQLGSNAYSNDLGAKSYDQIMGR